MGGKITATYQPQLDKQYIELIKTSSTLSYNCEKPFTWKKKQTKGSYR